MAFGGTHLSLALCLMALIVLAKANFDEKIEPINNILEQNSEMLSQEFCIFGAVGSVVSEAIRRERRMGASLIRLFFHDCFVDVSSSSSFKDFTRSVSIYMTIFDYSANL